MNDASPTKPTLKVSRQGKEIGEYDAESIQAMLDGGILNGTEFCWQSGFKNWVPIASLFNVPTDIDQQDGEATGDEPTDEPEAHASAAPRGKLLSPTAIANLSLLFGPFWGAYLVSRNWEAIGDHGKARRSLLWLTIGLPVSLAIWFATGIPVTFPWVISGILGLLSTLAWYYFDGKKQMNQFKEDGIVQFSESWVMPICLGLVIVSGILFLGAAWAARE